MTPLTNAMMVVMVNSESSIWAVTFVCNFVTMTVINAYRVCIATTRLENAKLITFNKSCSNNIHGDKLLALASC